MTDHLVTDAEAKGWTHHPHNGPARTTCRTCRLLATRALCIEALEMVDYIIHSLNEEVRFLGGIPQPFGIPTDTPTGLSVKYAHIYTLLAELHGDSTSGTSAPPETEQP